MQASLGNTVKGEGDNEDVHFEDTVRGSDWGCDQDVARLFVHTAPQAVRELAAWGVPWNRIKAGDREVIMDGKRVTLTEGQAAHGLIAARDFGGTKKWRTCYVSDGTGHAMLYAVSDQAVAERIPVHERMEALALIHEGGRCHGAVVRNLVTGELSAYVAKATCIATGGFGRIYRVTSNAVINEGIGAAIALETGAACWATWRRCSFTPPPSSRPASSLPKAVVVMAGCSRTPPATASCPTTSRRRRSWPPATWSRAAWRSTSAPAMA
jgi:fumarate reductase flavoprotein subunit